MYTLRDVRVDTGKGKELYGDDYADIYAILRLHSKAAMSQTCDRVAFRMFSRVPVPWQTLFSARFETLPSGINNYAVSQLRVTRKLILPCRVNPRKARRELSHIDVICRLLCSSASSGTLSKLPQFHDGLGFLTSHFLISNTFEYSFQLVNPKLSLPYWDFTIEDTEAEISFDDDDLKTVPPLFQESWFGSADPDDNIVKDVRWAYTEIHREYSGNPGDLNSDMYGLLWSHWNVNSSPYLTRGMGTLCNTYDVTQVYELPTCELHYWMATEYSDFYSWVWTSILIGEDNANSLALYAFDQRKDFWLDGFFNCEGTAVAGATEDDVFSEGMCGCLGFDLSSNSDDWQTIYYNSPSTSTTLSAITTTRPSAWWSRRCAPRPSTTATTCSCAQAGSSLNPTSWPMHPTMERLFMFARLTRNIYDMDRPDTSSANHVISCHGDDCAGHGGSDVFTFDLLDSAHDGFEIKTGKKGNPEIANNFTNREVLASMDARTSCPTFTTPSIRDHCLTSGYDFDTVWDFSSTASAEDEPKSTMKIEPTMRTSGLIRRRVGPGLARVAPRRLARAVIDLRLVALREVLRIG
ncbi:unnamed protein product [Ectocarpus sp. CCAP 1310/34]|nr:unnamed protein product [Ectocarpus sp. CCAP 1310/34]